jgi:hypothetical protein
MNKSPPSPKPERPPTKPARQHIEVADDAIRALAYDLWEKAGRTEVSDVDFWLEARLQLFDAVKPPARLAKTKSPAPAKPRAKKS